jgi:hypothetical protein
LRQAFSFGFNSQSSFLFGLESRFLFFQSCFNLRATTGLFLSLCTRFFRQPLGFGFNP